MSNLFRFDLRSIRGKLTLAAVTPLAVVLLLLALAASWLINASIVEQAQKRVRHDLTTAHDIIHHEQQRVSDVVRFTAHSPGLFTVILSGKRESINLALEQIRQREQLDFLYLTDNQGIPLPSHTAESGGESTAALSFIQQALQSGQASGKILLDRIDLLQLNPELAERAEVFAPEQKQVPLEQRGMFLVGATRLVDAQGRLLGCLAGGILLNNNLGLVDRIRTQVYGQEHFEGIDIGSATIFLGRLRIATTVRLKNGERALGTWVSDEVAETVLQQGNPWLARAHVVNEWYLTAYEPITSENDKVLGALYVGMLEKPFNALKGRSYMLLLSLLVVGCLLGGLLARLLARRLSRPVLELATSAEKIAAGERELCLPKAGQDEIGHLTNAFAGMTSALKKSDDELQSLNRDLEKKVRQRTAQLEEKSRQLIKVQESLLRSEKLAAIGSLAAGVAHEINNPAAIIRGNIEILQMGLAADAPEREETREIIKQVERVSLITQNLLNFAGQQDLHQEQVLLKQLLEEILGQISHQQPLDQIQLNLEFDELLAVPGDRERLRQVFTNIILNALQAMEGSGTLRLTGTLSTNMVIVTISDSGPGIPDSLREKIFNPFFTTKRQGTGLGLSVSYGIIQDHAGTLELVTGLSSGASFKVSLPLIALPE